MNWPMFRQAERRARRLNDMIRRLGVDTLCLVRLRQGDAYTEAQEKCLQCHNAEECLQWLENDAPENEHPHFCPTLSILESCRVHSHLNHGVIDPALKESLT